MTLHRAATCFVAVALTTTVASAEDALVAVASNFSEAIDRLETDFEQATPHSLTVATGSTGKLYAQLIHGAPFEIFLAADQRRPRLLEEQHRVVAGSRFTYAIGRLTLWSPDSTRIAADGAETLRAGAFHSLAIANPDLAPYGAAAREALTTLGMADSLQDKLVMGENIGQTHALVATGNAELGFVALSYVLSPRNKTPGSRWDLPRRLYRPIRQDAVLLARGADNPAARAFLAYLNSPRARALIQTLGYTVD